jgi:REP element-mobilizing transposase RayT
MARSSRRQLELPVPPTWGGRRRGAGRPPTGSRPGLPHDPREEHEARCPVHVTLRCRSGVPSLRSRAIFPRLRNAIAAANRIAFRVVHFSAQTDHLHLLIEAELQDAFVSGVSGLAIRCALAINRATGRRGSVWSDRYHAHALRTPSEVRSALAYVLLSFCKHLRAAPRIDPCSSGSWFDGWAHPREPTAEPRPVASPRTWLLATGWRRAGGPIDWREAPRPAR